MKIETKTLAAAIASVLPAASTDDTRPHLNGIYFDTENVDAGVARVVATDGSRMHACEFYADDELDDGCPLLGFTIELDGANRLVREAGAYSRKHKKTPTFTTICIDQSGKLLTAEMPYGPGICGQTIHCAVVDEQFPPYAKVIPNTHEVAEGTTPHSSLNFRYVTDAMKAAGHIYKCDGKASTKGGGVQFRIAAPLDPARLDIQTPQHFFTAVIMPMRSDVDGGLTKDWGAPSPR